MTANLPSVEDLWYRYSVQSSILSKYRDELFDAIINGSRIEPTFEPRITYDEAISLFKQLQDDLDTSLIFNLIASAEATIRLDYINRAQDRHKDKLSREYRSLWKKLGRKTRLKDDLLKLWIRHYPELRGAVNRYLQLLPVRHWIAHGRYYPLRAKIQVPQLVREAVDEILSAGVII